MGDPQNVSFCCQLAFWVFGRGWVWVNYMLSHEAGRAWISHFLCLNLIVIWADVKKEISVYLSLCKRALLRSLYGPPWLFPFCFCIDSYFCPFLRMLMPKLPEYLSVFFFLIWSIQNNSKGVKRFCLFVYVMMSLISGEASRNPLETKG